MTSLFSFKIFRDAFQSLLNIPDDRSIPSRMIEVYHQTGVYWYRGQRDAVFFNSKGPEQAMSRAIDVFFT